MNLYLHTVKTTRALSCIALALAGLHVMACIPHFFYGRGYPFAPFNLDTEQNIPTLFATLILFFAAGLAANIAQLEMKTNRSNALRWLGFSAVFLFLGTDEFIGIHEQIGGVIQNRMSTAGLFLFAWVIPYALILLALIVFNIRFVKSLPRNVSRNLAIGAGLYLGSIAMEMVSGPWVEAHGRQQLFYLFVGLEETLEMFGTIAFIRAFMNRADQLPNPPKLST